MPYAYVALHRYYLHSFNLLFELLMFFCSFSLVFIYDNKEWEVAPIIQHVLDSSASFVLNLVWCTILTLE